MIRPWRGISTGSGKRGAEMQLRRGRVDRLPIAKPRPKTHPLRPMGPPGPLDTSRHGAAIYRPSETAGTDADKRGHQHLSAANGGHPIAEMVTAGDVEPGHRHGAGRLPLARIGPPARRSLTGRDQSVSRHRTAAESTSVSWGDPLAMALADRRRCHARERLVYARAQPACDSGLVARFSAGGTIPHSTLQGSSSELKSLSRGSSYSQTWLGNMIPSPIDKTRICLPPTFSRQV